MIKTEKDYQNIVMKRLREAGGRWYKIPDVSMQIKPFDIFGFQPDYIDVDERSSVDILKPIAIELKICNLKKGLNYQQMYKMLRPNQVGALQSFQKHGGQSYIWVYNIAEQKEYQSEFLYLSDIDVGAI